MIKVLLAEDHNIVRDGIKNVLEKDGKFQVIGQASNGVEVLQLLQEGMAPDIVLADINMPQMTGLELAEKLKDNTAFRNAKLVLLTMVDNENYVFKAFRAGALGYLLKDVSADELTFALSHITGNKPYICSDLSIRLLERAGKSKMEDPMLDLDFSKREKEVLELIAQGYTNQQIADRLFTS